MPIHSLLFVPSKPKMLAKVQSFQSDAFILDLEDAIEEEYKAQALQNAVSFLGSPDAAGKKMYIRLNKTNFQHEAEILSDVPDVGFMLPKFEDTIEYEVSRPIWEHHPVIALVETPRGIVNMEKIASCAWVAAVAFGAEDYTASVNMENKGSWLVFQKSVIVTYGKAFGKLVYDTPSFQLNDPDALEKEVRESAALGFDGKLAIHPRQVDAIGRAFSATDIGLLQRIVEAYEQQGEAVMVYDGVAYEKMHINRFRRIIKENGGSTSWN